MTLIPDRLDSLTDEEVAVLSKADQFDAGDYLHMEGRWYTSDLTQWPDALFRDLYLRTVERMMQYILEWRSGALPAPHVTLRDYDSASHFRPKVLREALRRGYV